MMTNTNLFVWGYDFDQLHDYGIKEPIVRDISLETNSYICFAKTL